MNEYPNLSTPLTVGRLTFKNRIIAAPLGRGRITPEGHLVERTYSLLEGRAKGGAAEVAVGETSVDFVHANREIEPTTDYTDYNAPQFCTFTRYAEVIHRHGAVSTIELSHVGNVRANLPGGKNPIGPMGYVRKDGVTVDAMDEAKMEETCEIFANAAAFMQATGFDGVIPHAGHGWLLSQFLSSLTNQRTDKYGGSLENRARFPLAVLKRIRERCGRDFLIEVRVSGDEMAVGGMKVDEVAEFCKMIEEVADMIHVSVGLYHDPVRSREFSSMFHDHACNAHLSEVIKKAIKIPVALVGGINDPALADRLIAEGKTDLIALGRQLTADPDWPAKVLTGRDDDIAKCLRCFCCFPGPKEDVLETFGAVPKLKCTVNPLADLDEPLDSIPAPEGARKVLVIGGGPGGMEAAITASEQGHDVTLVEKTDSLGGLLKFADVDVYKKDLKSFKDLLICRINQHNIHVLLNTEATPDFIASEKPEAVILAMGSNPVVLPIKGIEGAMHALVVYKNIDRVGRRVVMVGGGLVGCETGLHLSKLGRQVTLIEMTDKVAADAYVMHRVGLLEEMEKHNQLICRTGLKCCEIMANGVKVTDKEGKEEFIEADTVVYALGMKANPILDNLLAAVAGVQVFTIGDCVRAGKVQQAIEEGFLAGMKII